MYFVTDYANFLGNTLCIFSWSVYVKINMYWDESIRSRSSCLWDSALIFHKCWLQCSIFTDLFAKHSMGRSETYLIIICKLFRNVDRNTHNSTFTCYFGRGLSCRNHLVADVQTCICIWKHSCITLQCQSSYSFCWIIILLIFFSWLISLKIGCLLRGSIFYVRAIGL